MIRELMLSWVDLFNKKEAFLLADLYHEEAINFQVATGIKRIGKKDILEMFRYEFEHFDMVCQPQRLIIEGNEAVLEWKDPNGLEGCGFFTLEGNKIMHQKGYWDRWSFEQKQGKEYN
jgi:hypothetical protein